MVYFDVEIPFEEGHLEVKIVSIVLKREYVIADEGNILFKWMIDRIQKTQGIVW